MPAINPGSIAFTPVRCAISRAVTSDPFIRRLAIASERRSAKFQTVFIGIVTDLGKHPFVIPIATQLVVILVAHKPRVVVVSQGNGASQPRQRLRLVAKQSIDAANPISPVAVSDVFWFLLE